MTNQNLNKIKQMKAIAKQRKESLKGVSENREFLKLNNVLYTTRDILAALFRSEGFSKNTKNRARVIKGLHEGYSILQILRDPINTIHIPANQLRYFKAFTESHKLSNRLYAPTRHGVLVSVASIDHVQEVDGKIVSTIDYSEVNRNSYKEISESFLSEMFAGQEREIEFTQNGQFIKKRVMLPMTNLYFVDLYLDLPEDPDEITEEQQKLIDLRERMVREGFYVTDENGNKRHIVFLLRTPSQARQLKAVFIDESFMKPTDALKLLGHDLLAYASKDNDGNWVVKVDKMISRPGLSGTTSIASKVVDIGNKVLTVDEETGEYRLVDGVHTFRVIEDRKVEITTGYYRAWDAKQQKYRVFNAEEHPITLTAADGAIFCDEEIYHLLAAEFGEFNDAWQIRLTPFVKGLMVFVPGLRKFYGDHIVALKSAVKGDFRSLLEAHPDFKPQLRIAMFNKRISRVKKYTDMPYQFIQASSLNVRNLWDVLKPHLDRIKKALHNAEIMKEYLGLEKVIDLADLDDEQQHFMLDRSLTSTLATFLYFAPWAYEDVQLKRYALDILKHKLAKWKVGNVPVEGHYRYMIQDPYAVLEAGTKYEKRNDKGELLIERRSYHIGPMEAYIPSANPNKCNLYVALGRNPMVAKGEWQVVRNVARDHYLWASKKGGFRNLCVMSVHDLATFGMGGADNDGDTCLTVTEESVVSVLLNNQVPPIMDISFIEKENGEPEFIGDGCPYSNELTGVYQIPSDMIVKQDNYKVTFTSEQYTDALFEEIHKLGIDYVVRTLKPNKIGYYTNIATILADAVRGLAYCIATKIDEDRNPLTAAKEAEYRADIKQYESWIDILRLIQGWEIDAAKHGGAYQEVMKDTLSFIQHPPKRLSYYSKKLGKRVWTKPNWLAARKGKDGHNLGSVLSRIYFMVSKEEIDILEELDQQFKEAGKHSLLAKLNASFDLDKEYFDELLTKVKGVKNRYGTILHYVYKSAEEKMNRLESQYGDDPTLLQAKLEELDLKTKELTAYAADQARELLRELNNDYPAHHIGYVAYYITYVDRKADSSLTFPWVIAREQFLQTLQYVQNKESQDQREIGEIVDTNFTLAVCIPDDIQKHLTREQVAQLAKEHGAYLVAQGDAYHLYIKDKEVGFVFNSKKNIEPLLGHDRYYIMLSAATLGNGTRTLNLEVGSLVKA